jgi:hypothetical protein
MSDDEEKKIFEEGGIIVTNKRVVCENNQFLFDDGYGVIRFPVEAKSLSEVVIVAFFGYGIIALIILTYAGYAIGYHNGFLIALIFFVLSSAFTIRHRYYKNNSYTVYMCEPGGALNGNWVAILKTADKLFAEKIINTIVKVIDNKKNFIKNKNISYLKSEMSQLK